MLKINKDYKCPFKETLEQEWIDWGNLLVDDGQCNNVTLHLDGDGNIIYNDDIKIPISSLIPTGSMMKSTIDDYYNDISQNSIAAV